MMQLGNEPQSGAASKARLPVLPILSLGVAGSWSSSDPTRWSRGPALLERLGLKGKTTLSVRKRKREGREWGERLKSEKWNM